MRDIALQNPHDLGAFRDIARRLIASNVSPPEVIWHGEADAGLFAGPELPVGEPLMVPGGFAQLAADVICHRDPERLALLYELLWRLTHGERHLLSVEADPVVYRLARMRKAIGRDVHKMHAFVRFRRVGAGADERFIAWFEPQHFILERATPFFVDRFTSMHWSILTPVGTAHWDGTKLTFGDAVARENAPAEDDFEGWWRTYYRATFNPARVNPEMMQSEMPKRYWRNLPEAQLIPELLAEAVARTGEMMEATPVEPRKKSRPFTLPPALPQTDSDLGNLAREAAGCQRCPLFGPATQTVFGNGPEQAPLMLVGEQPGDQEDLAGRAFVGPAGQLLDKALSSAGIDRSRAYLTNAVKHFKFEPRGKRRIHKSPAQGEIEQCRWWLQRELALVRPELVVALGATAAQALLGRSVKILSERSTFVEHPAGFKVLITVHPSFLLRIPDAGAREYEFTAFVRDLGSARAAVADLEEPIRRSSIA